MDEKIPNSKIIETEIPMGTVHPAALEPYRVRLFVEDEIVQEAEITIGVNFSLQRREDVLEPYFAAMYLE